MRRIELPNITHCECGAELVKAAEHEHRFIDLNGFDRRPQMLGYDCAVCGQLVKTTKIDTSGFNQDVIRVAAMGCAIRCECGHLAPVRDFSPAHIPNHENLCPACGVRWGRKAEPWEYTGRDGHKEQGYDIQIYKHAQLELGLEVV